MYIVYTVYCTYLQTVDGSEVLYQLIGRIWKDNLPLLAGNFISQVVSSISEPSTVSP